MSLDFPNVMTAVTELRHAVPVRLDHPGPVSLAACFEETGLDHVELPHPTQGTVAQYLHRAGIPADDLGEPTAAVAGSVFVAGGVGWAFV
jgi:hypothetical protein